MAVSVFIFTLRRSITPLLAITPFLSLASLFATCVRMASLVIDKSRAGFAPLESSTLGAIFLDGVPRGENLPGDLFLDLERKWDFMGEPLSLVFSDFIIIFPDVTSSLDLYRSEDTSGGGLQTVPPVCLDDFTIFFIVLSGEDPSLGLQRSGEVERGSLEHMPPACLLNCIFFVVILSGNGSSLDLERPRVLF